MVCCKDLPFLIELLWRPCWKPVVHVRVGAFHRKLENVCAGRVRHALASGRGPFTLVSLQKPHGPGGLELLYHGTFAPKITTELCGPIFRLFYKANAAEAARSSSIPTLSVIFLSAPKYIIKAVRASSSLQATSKTKDVNSVFLFERVDMYGFKVTALELK